MLQGYLERSPKGDRLNTGVTCGKELKIRHIAGSRQAVTEGESLPFELLPPIHGSPLTALPPGKGFARISQNGRDRGATALRALTRRDDHLDRAQLRERCFEKIHDR